jgi:hypothetical protein
MTGSRRIRRRDIRAAASAIGVCSDTVTGFFVIHMLTIMVGPRTNDWR